MADDFKAQGELHIDSNMGEVNKQAQELSRTLEDLQQKADKLQYTLSEKSFTDKATGKRITYPVVSSERFTGQVRPDGRGYVRSGESLSARDLLRMAENNNPSRSGRNDIREIVKEVLVALKGNLASYEMEGIRDEEYMESPPRKVYPRGAKREVEIYRKYEENDQSDRIKFQDDYSTRITPTKAVPMTEKEYLSDSFIRSFSNNSSKFNVDKTTRILADSFKRDFEEYKKAAFDDLNEELMSYATRGQWWEDFDPSGDSQALFEHRRKQQSDRESHYAGYNKPDYDSEYELGLTRKFERQVGADLARKSLKERAKAVRQGAPILPETSDDYKEQTVSSDFKSLVRYFTQGYILSQEPDIDKTLSMDDRTTAIYGGLKNLSSFVMNDPDIGKYFQFNRGGLGSNAELGKNLPQVLEKLQEKLITFLNSSKGQALMPEVYKQTVQRVYQISALLGSLEASGQDRFSSDMGQIWRQQIERGKKKLPSGEYSKNVFDPDAKRSILAKQGIEVGGSYDIWDIPQYLTGELTFFPTKDAEGEILPKEQVQVESLNRIAQQIIALTNERNRENTSTERKSQIEDTLSLLYRNLNNVYLGLSDEQVKQASSQGAMRSFVWGENGLKFLKDFTSEDFSAVATRYKEAAETGKMTPEQIKKLQSNLQGLLELARKTLHGSEGELDEVTDKQSAMLDEILNDFDTQETFSKADFEELKKWEPDLKDLDITTIPWNEQGEISRENLERYIDNLGMQKSDDYDRISTQIQQIDKDLDTQYYQQVLQPYLEQYQSATTAGGKAAITKKIKSDFGSDSKEFLFYKENKDKMLKKLSRQQEKEKEEMQEQIAFAKEQEKNQYKTAQEIVEESENIPDSSPLVGTKGADIVTGLSGKYIADYTTDFVNYKGEKKTYTGPAVVWDNKPTFVTDIKKQFEMANDEGKDRIIQQLQELYNSFNNEQKEWLLAELDNYKEWTFSNSDLGLKGDGHTRKGLTSLAEEFKRTNQSDIDFQKRLKNSTDLYYKNDKGVMIRDESKTTTQETVQEAQQTVQALSKEEDAVESLNQDLEAHEEKVQDAVEAERAKIVVSKDLAGALNQENKAVQEASSSYEKHSDIAGFDGIELEGFTPTFDSKAHQYYDENGNPIYSSTQLRDMLLGKSNPTFKQDLENIKNVASNKTNGALKASEVGMNENDFRFITENVIGSGLRGDLFHSLVDKMVKSNSTTLEELEQNDNQAFKEYQEQYKKTINELAKYGLGDEFLSIEARLQSYIDAMKQSGMTPTEFSEQQLGFRLKGPRGDISVGVTPDQLYSMGGAGTLIDNKTGNVKGYEAFQLTAQQLGIIANWDKIKGSAGDVDINLPMEGYIADVKDGITQLIKYILLSRDEFYELAMDAKDIADGVRSPLNENEVQSRMNRQLKGERIIGLSDELKGEGYTSESAFSGELFGSSKKEIKAISEYIAQFRKVINLQAQMGKTQREIRALQESGSETELKAKQEVWNRQNEQLKVLKKGLEDIGKYDPDSGPYGKLGNLILSEDGGKGLQQKVNEIKANALTTQAKDQYNKAKQPKNRASSSGLTTEENKLLKEYSANLSAQGQIERNIARYQQVVDSSTGSRKKEHEELIRLEKDRLAQLKTEAPIIDETNKTIKGQVVSEQAISEAKRIQQAYTESQAVQMQKINAQAKQQKGLIQQIAEGFKASFRNLVDYSAAYQVIGYMRQMFSTTIQTTKDLDSAMVSLQIASGETYDSIYEMTKGFNELGKEMGRSTRDVATAADDWLRAGYAADEANQLVKASMDLSTLGQIESADATSYLISMLKGWKLEVESVSEVVDKLTVNTTAYVSQDAQDIILKAGNS